MVYIKRLTLQGFKSFGPRRTTIDLEKGLVVVTGPNGGGKSNIMDAVRFALGELSAHNLRVGRMSELVHDRPNVASAKVSITLDNAEGALPVDSPEVTISRRIDRSGESEYLLNGRAVSRSELLTLLSMANIKPSGFNVVPQGSVIEVAEMSGVELRRMLEEVAGIGDYEKRRQEAEQQLAIAEKNIAIAKASTSEVRLRVKQLERERNQAMRRAQAEALLNALKSSRLTASLKSLEAELGEVDSESLRVEEELAGVESERRELEAEHGEVKGRWREAEAALRAVEERVKGLEEERGRLGSEAGELRVRVSVMEERLRGLREEKPYLESRLTALRKELRELSEKAEVEEQGLREAAEKLEAERLRRDEALTKLRGLEAELERLRKRLEDERRALELRALRARAKVGELGRALRRVRERASEAGLKFEAALTEFSEAWKALEARAQGLEELERRLQALGPRLDPLRRRLRRGRALERKLSAFIGEVGGSGLMGDGLDRRALLSALSSAGVGGVYGFLDEELEAGGEVWRELEAATEGWVHGLVVEDWALALQLARALSEQGVNLKLIPLDIARASPKGARPRGVRARSRWAEEALRYLTSGVEVGGALAPPRGARLRVASGVAVYSDGRVESPPGGRWLIKQLLSAEYRRAVGALETLRAKLQSLELDEERAARVEAALREAATRLRAELNALEERLSQAYKAASESKASEVEAALEALETLKELRRAAGEVYEAGARLRGLEAGRWQEELGRLSEEVERVRAEYEGARTRYVELAALLKPGRRRLEELRASVDKVSGEVSALEERLRRLESEELRLLEEASSARERLREVEERLAGVESELRELLSEREKLREKVEGLRRRLEELAERRRRLDEAYRELSSKRSSLAVRRAQLEGELTRVREALQMLGEREPELPELPEELRAGLERALEEELKELEMINQLAPKQYEELVGNYKLRSSRISELEAERREILRFLEWVEGEKRRAFMETFNKVSEAFERFFARLTGGQAWLRLENPENPFEGGVEMVLRFPGKAARSARSASGGEKSVAAVALLLALQGLTPAEFYIFDEVDAHMDLQYSLRLAQLFKEMARKTQLIVISLKDVVAEQADQLIGVYSSRGESRAVKTTLEEVKAVG